MVTLRGPCSSISCRDSSRTIHSSVVFEGGNIAKEKMEYIVDVQGFKKSLNQFVFKEVAIVAVQDDALPTVFHFKPPCEWNHLSPANKSSNVWLKYNLHGISWRSGNISYNKLEETMEMALSYASKIYVKGLEKKMWLKEVLPEKKILNIEDIGCPALNKLPKDGTYLCSIHTFGWNPVCAAQNAHMVKNWLKEHRLKSCDVPWTGPNLGWEGEGVDEIDRAKLFSMYN